MDKISRLSADEMLHSPNPFAPQWFSNSDNFDLKLTTFPVRLINFDSDRINFSYTETLNRVLYKVAFDREI